MDSVNSQDLSGWSGRDKSYIEGVENLVVIVLRHMESNGDASVLVAPGDRTPLSLRVSRVRVLDAGAG